VAKATTRAAANTSPEPFSNIALSLVDDGLVPFVLWLSWAHPVLLFVVLGIAVVVMLATIWILARFLRRAASAVALRYRRPMPPAARSELTSMSALPSRVKLVDVGPRDGLQNEKQAVRRRSRSSWCTGCRRPGCRRSRSPASSARSGCRRWATTPRSWPASSAKPGWRYSVLVPNMKGLDTALSAPREQWPDEVVVFGRRERGLQPAQHQLLDRRERRALPAGGRGRQGEGHQGPRRGISVALGCPYQGEVSADEVEHVVKLMKEIGVDHCGIADTIGVGTPRKVQAAMERALRHFPIEEVSGHFHDTYAQARRQRLRRARGRHRHLRRQHRRPRWLPLCQGRERQRRHGGRAVHAAGAGHRHRHLARRPGRRRGLHLRRARQKAGVALGECAAREAGVGRGKAAADCA
jgi:hydroxymethylglutaryl-CoA lyase